MSVKDAYARKKARKEATEPTYSVGGATYETKTGNLLGGNYTSPTVLTDANIREDVIPTLNNKATNLYGTPYQAKDQTKKTDTGFDYSKILGSSEEAIADVNPLDQEYTQLQEDVFKQAEIENTEKAQKAAASVTDLYSRRRRDIGILQSQAGAQEASLRGSLFASGASRYGSVSGGGLVTSTEKKLMNELSDLAIQEQEAIQQVKDAQKEGDYRIMQARLDYAEGIRKERETARTKLLDDIMEENKKVREKQIQATRDSAVAGLLAQNPEMSMTDMLDALNETGGDFTADELAKTVKNLTGEKDTKKAWEGLSADLQDFYNMRENYPEAIPSFIQSLPPDQQPYAYVKYVASLKRAPTQGEKPFAITATGKSKLIAAGMSSEKIKGIQDYLSEYGFDDTLRQSLGPTAEILESVLNDTGEDISASELNRFINRQLATPEFKAMSDDEKTDYIHSLGGNPYDYSY